MSARSTFVVLRICTLANNTFSAIRVCPTHSATVKGGHLISRPLCTEKTRAELPTANVTFKSLGVTFNATYADAGDPKGPAIVCLHGAPASHKDFAIISPYLLSAGVRLIAPNFPGYGYCKVIDGDSYNFTVEHKAAFLKNLFEAIGVDRISVLVSHSASGATTGQFCADTDLVQSVAFLSAINISRHNPARYGRYFIGTGSWLMSNRIIGKAMRKLLPPIAIKLSGFRVSDPGYMIGLVHEMAAVNWAKSIDNLKLMSKSPYPVLVIGCEEDKVVEVEIAKEKMKLFNIDRTEDVLYINADGVCTNVEKIENHKDKRRRGIIFAKGGHWIQNSHPEIIAMAILDLLKLVQK
ncbi:uncharacterized protein F35H12.5-like [Ptychodera flava]|uniref:uncharacterized protein F35H12.5-like n=1 Tax=Ptychodera flava TaxID=63121 RepID=UPI00396A1836